MEKMQMISIKPNKPFVQNCFLSFYVLFFVSHSGLAEDEPSIWEIIKQEGGSVSIVNENDYYVGTDRDYTNGLRFSLNKVYKDENGNTKILNDDDNQYYRLSAGIHLANNLYTGSDIELTIDQIPDDDRPYAGWTYVGVAKERVYTDESIVRWEFDIGCIGPCSGSEEIQTWWHESVINSPISCLGFSFSGHASTQRSNSF